MSRVRERRADKSAGQVDTWQALIVILHILDASRDSDRVDGGKTYDTTDLLEQARRQMVHGGSLSAPEAAKRQIAAIGFMERAIPLLEREASGGAVGRVARRLWRFLSSAFLRARGRDPQLTLDDDLDADIPDLVRGLLGDLRDIRTRIEASAPQVAHPGARQAARMPNQNRSAPQGSRGGKRHRAGFHPAH